MDDDSNVNNDNYDDGDNYDADNTSTDPDTDTGNDEGDNTPDADNADSDTGFTYDLDSIFPPIYDDEDEDEDEEEDDDTGNGDDDTDDSGNDDDDEDDRVFDRSYVKKLRAENAKARKKANTAAKESREKLVPVFDSIARFVGEDGFDFEKGTHDDLAKAIQEKVSAKDNELRAARIENAVIRESAKSNVDVDALMDSKKFDKAVRDLDVNDKDFQKKVSALVSDFSKGNSPRNFPDRSGGDFSSGSNSRPKGSPKSIEDFIALRRGNSQ